MPDTASNSGRMIATKGSNHQALATAPDVCKVPPGVPAPFPNFIPTTRAGAGKTSNTFIANKEIVLDRTFIGPMSDPAHAGVLGGVSSGTYRFEAQATSYSKDVFAESGPVVRSFDSTIQNHGNTTGLVLSALDYQKLKAEEEAKKKKCVIDKFEGQCSHGRKLGWPGTEKNGEPYYLEVLDDDEVIFNTERKDVTDKSHAKDPACAAGNHTAWYAEVVKFPNPAGAKGRKPEGGTETTETFTVPATLAIDDWVLALLGYDKGLPTDAEHELSEHESEKPTRQKYQQEALGKLGSNPTRADRADAIKGANKRFNQYQYENGQMQRANPTWKKQDIDRAKEAYLNVREAILLWTWYNYPPEISVKAFACGGSRSAKIKVFPSKQFRFEVALGSKRRKKAVPTNKMQERAAAAREKKNAARLRNIKRLDKAEAHFQIIYRTLNAMRVLLGLAEKIADCAGPVMGSKLNIEFLKGLKIEFTYEYKECTKTDGRFPKDKRTPAHVGRAWEIFIGAKPLIGVNGYITFPLLNLGPPGVGWLASKIIKLEIFFAGKTTISMGGTIGRDEYDYCTSPGAALTGTLRFEAGLDIGLGRWKAIQVAIVFHCAFSGKVCLFIEPDCLIGLKTTASISGSVTVVVNPDGWLFRKELVNWQPEWAQIKLGPKSMTLLPMIK